mmetsp:Transcript_3877/g.9337  ORF Transcript_3877/g.9337 Transcript_3877/m.9337 type:complete len:157 (-) Transcript_3877:675-1145(-)
MTMAVLAAKPNRTLGKTSPAVSKHVSTNVDATEMGLRTDTADILPSSSSSHLLVFRGFFMDLAVDVDTPCTARPVEIANIAAPNSLAKAASRPNKPHVIATESKPADCEAVKNVTTVERFKPLPNKVDANGSAPQLHSGVANPARAAATSPMNMLE